MAMTLRLSDEQTEALRRRAAAEDRSMQQVALAAIDAYVSRPISQPQRRRAVPVKEFLAAFSGLEPIDADRFRADQDRYVDTEVRLDAYDRDSPPETTE